VNRIIRISEAHMVQSARVDIDDAGVPQEETEATLDPMHLRIVEALLFAAAETARATGACQGAAGRYQCVRSSCGIAASIRKRVASIW